jgi:hypothetical protein
MIDTILFATTVIAAVAGVWLLGSTLRTAIRLYRDEHRGE